MTKNLNSTDFLHHKNMQNENFIQYYLYESDNNETTEILDWIKENDEEYLTNFILNFAMATSNNLIDQICIFTHRTVNIPNALKAVTSWLDLNVPYFDKNEILLRSDIMTKYGYGNFTLELILERNPNDAMIQALIDIMSWMNELNIDFLFYFLYKLTKYAGNLLHHLCEKFMRQKKILVNLIIEIIRWTKLNKPNFKLTFLLINEDDSGRTFLEYFAIDHEEKEKGEFYNAIVTVLDFLKKMDKRIFNEIIYDTKILQLFSTDEYLSWNNSNIKTALDSWIKNNMKFYF